MRAGKAFVALCASVLVALVAWAGVDRWLMRRRWAR